jgi:hypothetical protein
MEYCQKSPPEKKEVNYIKTALLDRVTMLSEHPCSSGLSFQSFMIMPIQRITRYVLLLAVSRLWFWYLDLNLVLVLDNATELGLVSVSVSVLVLVLVFGWF